MQIIIKNASEIDLNEIVWLENKIWPEGTRATIDKFVSRLKIFPEGFFLALNNREIIGFSTSEIISYDSLNPPISWESITDNGYIKNTHNTGGNALYVVSIGAKSRSGGGSALINAQKQLTKKLNLRRLVLGARIPGYNNYCAIKEISIEGYTKLVREDKELYDPELRFYSRNGLKLFKIMPNYMEDDQESRNYGAIMIWDNPNVR